MKPLSKRKENQSMPKPNVVTKKIHAGYKFLQGSWASWMMKRTEKFTRRTWIMLLVFFVLSGTTYSIYIAVNAFFDKSNSITVTPIRKPGHATQTGKEKITGPEISQVEYDRIKRFRIYMDSLAQSPSGKIYYDSITSQRPGLMDSVLLIENYYQQINQK